jgi:CP family cyanate transporter-like MFS transporter
MCWTLLREPPHASSEEKQPNRVSPKFHQVLLTKNIWLVACLLFLNEFFIQTWIGWAPALMMLKGASPELAGYISSMTVWIGIPTVLLMPRLAYRLGVRKPFLWVPSISLGLIAWGAIHAGLSLGWLLMALAGISEVTRFITIMALPIEMMAKEEVGTASGLIFSIGFAGGVVGPWIGGHILDVTGSLDLSLLMLIGVSAAAAAVAFRVPETGPKAEVEKKRTLS